ncbi:hypothetical protein NM208_g6648 [Fusarium decemcellulare]|uniref:Uncharacterized protein n=1 Tax=Fusarium decemcellulare TaxID=57161 RepID=A0ACC1SCJ1_9HYPO|nr:hypothetical protein NM208_g6648 [Fusarium decemcellulare]
MTEHFVYAPTGWRQWLPGGFNVALLTIAMPLLLTYLITLWNSTSLPGNAGPLKRPRTVPYMLPNLGHGLAWGLRGTEFLHENAVKFGRKTLHKIVLPGLDQYVTTSPEHVRRVFRAEKMGMTESHTRAMEKSFGMSPKAVELYRADDSGYGPSPAPGSAVEPGDRILLEIHNLVNRNLTGASLATITAQFQTTLAEQLSELDTIGDEWVEIPDLNAFMRTHIMKAALTAMFGPHLIDLNPTFVDDFWVYNADIGPLYMGLPQWLIPGAYRRREKMLQSIMRWHKFAHEHYDCSNVGEQDTDWEPYFGSKFSRRRQNTFAKWEVMDAKAKAAEDLSFIWASNANSGFAAIWFLLEILRDPTLMARVQKEFSPAIQPPLAPCKVPTFDIDKLCSGPLCQSIYAEVLRLRVALLVSRKAKEDLNFDGWRIREGERVAVATCNEALDEVVWNSGTESDPHPLKTFWADRFLIYPGDENSGPLRKRLSTATKKTTTENGDPESSATPKFSMEGLTNSWIPYSGGVRHCPGRHFAKQEMIVMAAMMTAAFEIELQTESGWEPENDLGYFGFGSMPPKGKIPCRMRRRSTQSWPV